MADDSIAQSKKGLRPFFLYWLRNESCTVITEHGYVGVTCRRKAREKDHRKTGRFPPNFVMEIIFTGSQPECLQKERELRPTPGIGWNLAVGGPGGYRYGHTPETRAKIGAASKKMIARYDIGAARRGKTHSAEHRARISKALTGKKASAEARAKMSATRLKLGMSAETKAKMRASAAARRGSKLSPEHIAKIVAYQSNRPPEHNAKLGAAQRGVKKKPEFGAKISAAKRGKPWSAAARAAHVGIKWSPETRSKLSGHLAKLHADKRGKKRSPETIAKIKAAYARKRLAAQNLNTDAFDERSTIEETGPCPKTKSASTRSSPAAKTSRQIMLPF